MILPLLSTGPIAPTQSQSAIVPAPDNISRYIYAVSTQYLHISTMCRPVLLLACLALLLPATMAGFRCTLGQWACSAR